MKILFLGDIVGRPGRDIVFKHLKQLQAENDIDFTIVNAENSAHGKGISIKIYYSLIAAGVDCITMGNHTYAKKEIENHLDECVDMVVPYNHLLNLHQGYKIYDLQGVKLCVVNMLGSALMYENRMDAFKAMDEILEETKDEADLYFVDFHAEATSEKMLFAQYYKDRVQTVVGTHTHVQTADERIMGKAAYISDVGMCGVYDSIIGRDINEMVNNLVLGQKTRYEVAEGDAILCGVVIDIDPKNKQATSIKRIQIRPY